MAARQVLLLALAAVTVGLLASPASAVDYTVGDSAGWTLKYPFSWPNDKTFRVGDTITFKYNMGGHTVVEVSGKDFKACDSGNKLGSWYSGSDTVKLDKAGNRWFFCGVSNHCNLGMRLLVTVANGTASSPSSAPGTASSPSSAPGTASSPSSAPSNYRVGGVAAALAAGAMATAVLVF